MPRWQYDTRIKNASIFVTIVILILIFDSFGLSTKEPNTIMNCLSCVIVIGIGVIGVGIVICAHLPLAQGYT